MTNKARINELQMLVMSSGMFTGGFVVLDTSENANLLGGEETNNCQGGNCVSGCGSNLAAQCGHNTNTVAGCGTKETLSAF
ncbi:MAG TPA: hypothetical protein VD996_03700 [Chitinophagaceae bacterium]|nr:hypothetical protein [Chitinophagaceae bacterium]